MSTAIFTICAKNYLAQARVLMASVAEHEPGATRIVVLSDRVDDCFALAGEAFSVIEAERLPIADFIGMSFRYDIMELATAVKPSVFLHLLQQRGFQRVIYLDPDIQLFRPLAAVTAAFAAGASGALTPHSLVPMPPGREVGNITFQRAGCYNLGFLALAAAPECLTALRWWEARLSRHCRRDQLEHGEFVDQKWMDLWPLLCPGTQILRDAGLNVAYWNLDQRPLRQIEGAWHAGPAPLVFQHFSGLRPGPPLVPSAHRRELDEPALGEGALLFRDYVRRLREARLPTTLTWPYAYGQFHDGRPIPFVLRQFYREELEALADPPPADPFACDTAFFAQCDGGPGAPAKHHLPRLLGFLARRYPDLGRHFTLTTGPGRLAYHRWFATEGETYFELPRWLHQAVIAPLDASPAVRVPS